MEKNYSLKIYKGIRGLNELLPEWHSILNSDHKIFDCHRFYKAILENLKFGKKEFYFFLVLDDEQPAALFPFLYHRLTIKKIANTVLELPNHSHFNNTDFIFRDDADMNSIFKFLISELNKINFRFDAMNLVDFVEESNVDKIISQSRFKKISFVPTKYHTLRLDSYAKISENLSTNFRRNIRRLKNKIEREGNFEFQSSQDVLNIETLFTDFIEVEASGWKGAKGTAIKMQKDILNFYTSLIESDCPHYSVEIINLKHGESTAGGMILIESGDTIYLLKIGYHVDYSHISPGHLLIDHVLQKYSNNEKYKFLNFYTSAEWIEVWNPAFRYVYLDLLFNNTIKGQLTYNLLNLSKKFIEREAFQN